MEPIEEIKQKLDVVSFIQPYVPLKQAGRNFKGLCPFHGEKTPSFMVSPERQTWHCFGCNKGGDVIAFYQEIEHLEFYEALQSLAERTGVVLKHSEPDQTRKKKDLYQINALAAKFYHYLLIKHKRGQPALEYVTSQRKLLSQTLETFNIGYAPAGWDNLLKFLKKHHISPEDAYKAGLVSKNQRGYFDMFRNRIMFPIYDHRGNIVAFAGRIFNNEQDTAKYINTAETSIYIKGNTLYGLYQNADYVREDHTVILVEGELDVLSSYQSGVKNVVAMKGTALTQNQISLLRRYATTLLIALDQDAAGQKATRRSIELSFQSGFNMRIVSLPFGNDVDDLAKASPKAWKSAIERAVPYYDWLLNNILSKYNLKDPLEKSKAAQEALPFVLTIDNEIIREHYLKRLAAAVETSTGTLFRMVKRNQTNQTKQRVAAEKQVKDLKPREVMLLAYLLSIILQVKDAALLVGNIIPKVEVAHISASSEKQIWNELVKYWGEHQDTFSADSFIQQLPNELAPTIDILMMTDLPFETQTDYAALEKDLYKTAINLQTIILKSQLNQVTSKMAKVAPTSDLYQQLNRDFITIQNELKRLSA